MKRHRNNIWLIYKKSHKKEANGLKKIYNLCLDKKKEIMKNTQFGIQNVFGDIISEDSISREPKTQLNFFQTKLL